MMLLEDKTISRIRTKKDCPQMIGKVIGGGAESQAYWR